MTPSCKKERRKAQCKKCSVRRVMAVERVEEFQATNDSESSKIYSETFEEEEKKEKKSLKASSMTTKFSTPKGKRFRIPENLHCPPPTPKKRRLKSSSSSSSSGGGGSSLLCSSQRPIFFTPPDLELFFLFAFHNVSF
ncbi:hypothetical protein IHE45_13G041200 [Dioscorea alata]|uniref:Uncharacterized protein n=1 Tax=Dioscorea alata TaxID=55571 RepID=A0ACB7UXV9_DIOAL|nr:hypothetical protein IHE45_13G041200 [Dioscorea alata]